jgi:hypothetical protein
VPARVAIRRLEIRGLAPRDHPAPGDLEQRLKDAARSFLPEALEQAVRAWSGEAVLRIRRLEVDVTIDAAFEPDTFAAFLARAIARELRRAEEKGTGRGGCEGVVCYPSRAIYLAALLKALAEGRAAERWWLRDAEGLRYLSPAQAIRTVVLAEPRVGLEALASLPPLGRMAVLRALTPAEAGRVLDGLAGSGTASAGFDACVETVIGAAPELPQGASALAVFIAAFARRPTLAGEALAAAARLWARIEQALREGVEGGAIEHALRSGADGGATTELAEGGQRAKEFVRPLLQSVSSDSGAAAIAPEHAQRMLLAAAARRSHPPRSEPLYRFTQFGGLLLLLPDLGFSEIAETVSTWPDAPSDAAALIAYAALGLCAGRERFPEYLGDGLWRELFGLDARVPASVLSGRLGAVPAEEWASFTPLLAPLDRGRDARFLLSRRTLVGSRDAARALAGLACAALKRFARRLPGFGDASAPFLWVKLLATTAAVERRPGGWSARLSRPPLDAVLSLARVGEGSVYAPSGALIDFGRMVP